MEGVNVRLSGLWSNLGVVLDSVDDSALRQAASSPAAGQEELVKWEQGSRNRWLILVGSLALGMAGVGFRLTALLAAIAQWARKGVTLA